MESIKISIAKDFSKTPGPRYIKEGNFSAELFLKDIFEEEFEKAIEANKKIVVDLDGTLGYATSFLEEVFGGLTRKYNSDKVTNLIKIISNEEPWLIKDINQYIEDVKREKE